MSIKEPKKIEIQAKTDVTKYKITWNRGESYDKSQTFEYLVDRKGKEDSWHKVKSVSKSDNHVTIDIGSKKDYSPTAGKPTINKIQVKIKGKKGKKESKWATDSFDVDPPKKPAVTGDGYHNDTNNIWSSERENYTRIDFAVNKDKKLRPFVNFELQTMIVENCTADSDKEFAKLNWDNSETKIVSKNKGYLEKYENQSGRFTRVYRIRARGFGGNSDWVYRWHVFGDSSKPNNVDILDNVKVDRNAQTISFTVNWDFIVSASSKPDYIQIEYFIGTPKAGCALPDNASFQVYAQRSIKGTGNNKFAVKNAADSETVILSGVTLGYDQCCWARVTGVKNSHANPPNAVLVAVGSLAPPVIKDFSPNSTTHRISVQIVNSSSVEDSEVAIVYRDFIPESIYDNKVLAILPHNKSDQQFTFQAPDWTEMGADNIGIDVFAFAGGSTNAIDLGNGITAYDINNYSGFLETTTWTTVSGYKQATIGVTPELHYIAANVAFEVYDTNGILVPKSDYDVLPQNGVIIRITNPDVTPLKAIFYYTNYDGIRRYMVSDSISDGSSVSVPKAPASVDAVLLEDKTTIQVTWKMTWTEADGAEVSWADHEDAWYSTSQPSTFDVTNVGEPKLNISDVAQGTIWYIRVRLYKNVDGSNKIYSQYTDYNGGNGLATSFKPNVPTLSLSDNVIPEFGKTTASWTFVSNDGTDQKQAILAEIIEGQEEPKPLEVVETAQHIVLRPSNYGWENGTDHKLVLKVISKSEKESDWSDEEGAILRIATTPICSIGSFGSTWESRNTITAPVTQTGASVTFNIGEGENSKVLADLIANIDYTGSKITGTIITLNGDEYEADWSNTIDNVYGGTFDLVTGILTVNKNSSGDSITPVIYRLGEQNLPLEATNNTVLANTGNITVITCDDLDRGNTLTGLPLSFTVIGAGETGQTYITITKLGSYITATPDNDNHFIGDGEVIVSYSYSGEEPQEINFDDLSLGNILEDSATYTLTAMVSNDAGEMSVADFRDFKVEWEHQALMPYFSVEAIRQRPTSNVWVAQITPVKPVLPDGVDPAEYANDTIDIYRLSADKPQLIYKGGNFDTVYIDPYPTIGPEGGYRVVYVTKNGDYTAGSKPAWTDIKFGLSTKFQLIDFDGDQIEFKYNIKLKNNWKKRFTKVVFLGGSAQGYWETGYDFDGSVDGNVFYDLEPETYIQLRSLGAYDNVCHLRTIDGTNICCNIDVSDSSQYNSLEHQHDISLSITEVDNPDLDGLTMADWKREE